MHNIDDAPAFDGMAVYQIYPRSFKDSDNTGVGDLEGITQKLDYLKWLGVGAIWLSPFYKSPMADFGYDVSDYCAVDPVFGTMGDFDELLSKAHQHGIKVLIDFVPNHTSDQHDWFQAARASRTNPKRDWYIWCDPKPDGSPPNNWLSVFGGSAWEFDQRTGQYYLHSFLKEQPDLNWRNASVRRAMQSVLRYWMDKGVDGFRFDAVYWIAKDAKLRNDTANPDYRPGLDNPYDALLHVYSRNQDELYGYLNELSEVIAEYDNRWAVLEAYPEKRYNISGYVKMYEQIDSKLMVPFNFETIYLPWDAKSYKDYIDRFQAALKPGFTPVYVSGNHDTPRLASRVGQGAARTAAMLLLTLPGTPFLYYGDELGMENGRLGKDHIRDPFEFNVPNRNQGRDPERTPMQWTPRRNAGFSRALPWLPVNGSYRIRDVETERQSPHSLLNLHRQLLHLRHTNPALIHGEYQPLELKNSNLYGFIRTYGNEKLAIVLNFTKKRRIKMPVSGELLLSTTGHTTNKARLSPFEGRIIKLP